MSKKTLLVLACLTLVVAAFFRLYQIGSMPGGLFPDEAANGLDINLMEQGHLQPFYERGNGREALFFYMLWAGVKAFGRNPFAHHFIVALVGIAAVLLCYLVTKNLFRNYGQSKEQEPETTVLRAGRKTLVEVVVDKITPPDILALLAMFIMAVSTWHVVLSRTAFRANLIPLFTALTFLALIKIPFAKTRARQYILSIAFGASFALGFYTYIAYRIMVPLLGLLVLWPFLAAVKTQGFKSVIRSYAPLLMASILSFVVFITPIAHYFYTHPGSFVGRSGQVSVFNEELNHGDLAGTVLEVSRLSMLAYFTEGDLNWRHNISGLPFLSPIVSPFFALGLLLVLYGAVRYVLAPVKQSRRYPHYFLAGWFFSFLIPVITTAEGIPHGLRSIGTIPAVFIITGYGLYVTGHFVWRMVKNYPHGNPRLELTLQRALQVLVICFAVALPVQTFASYFVYAANSPENFYAFRSDLTVVSDYLKRHGSRDNTYLVLDKFSLQTVDYFTTIDGPRSCDTDPVYRPTDCIDNPRNRPYMQVDPEDSWRSVNETKDNHFIWEKGLQPNMLVVFAQSSIFDITKFKESHPDSHLETEVRNKFGQTVLAVYRMGKN